MRRKSSPEEEDVEPFLHNLQPHEEELEPVTKEAVLWGAGNLMKMDTMIILSCRKKKIFLLEHICKKT